MEYKTTDKINNTWSKYDKTVAKCHLSNYGKIFLDEYGALIDDDFLIEELLEE